MDLYLSLVGKGCVSSMTPMHAARDALVVTHARKNTALANKSDDLVLRSNGIFYVSVHHVFCHAGNAGNECADIAAFLGMKVMFSVPMFPLFGRKMFFGATPPGSPSLSHQN